jgi:uncharacterized membrane protein
VDDDERLRRRAMLLTIGLVVVIALIALAVMIPAAIHSWRAYSR